MLTKILTVLGNVVVNVILAKIQLWWAKRQAEYHRRKAELEKQRIESLKVGKSSESQIRRAGDTAVIHAAKADRYESKAAELRRRAEERRDEVA